MTEPEPQKYADRAYRSGSAIVAGVLLLGLAGWPAGDAVLRGAGRTPLTAVSVLLFLAPLVAAYTFRPAVFASDERVLVRNPFRTITVPWGLVEGIRAGYSTELLAAGATYQMWAIPVSLRARSQANRHNEKVSSGRSPRGGQDPSGDRERTAPGDAAVTELRELAERHRERKPGGLAGEAVTVRWCYEVMAPAAAGALALLALWLTR